jgi:hypothetical protein
MDLVPAPFAGRVFSAAIADLLLVVALWAMQKSITIETLI